MVERDNYWLRSRSSRRRFLGAASTVGVGAAAMALTGCGDDDDDSASPTVGLATPTSAPNASPTAVNPFAGAKSGGTHRVDSVGDPPTIDPYANVSVRTKTVAAFVYSRLFKYKTGPQYRGASVRPVGDLAEKVETTPDGLKWTIKLRTGAKFQQVAPVNGRAVTTDDVKFSWGRATAEKNGNRGQLSFVDKVEYPDASTVVFTLKHPNAAFLDVLADSSLLWIMPTESDGGFNPATTMIGSGPWIFDSYQVSTAIKFKKNPNWYETGFPLVDAVEMAIIPEYATRVTQFLAGNTHTTALNSSDLVEVKKQMSDAQFGADASVGMSMIYFDPDPSSPWHKDDRVRQAVSMCLDRDGLTDLGFSIKQLRANGIEARDSYNNIVPVSVQRFWLDPKSKEQGETSKFFAYDVAEAKKLLAAAGYPDGFSTTYQYTGNGYGKEHNDIAEATIAMLNAIGIKTTTDVQDYNSKYLAQTFQGNFKGIAFGLETSFPEGSGYVLRYFTENTQNHGKVKDPVLEKLALQQQSTMDEEKRKQIFYEIQRENAKHMYYVPSQAGAGTRWLVYSSKVKNALNFHSLGYGWGSEVYPYRWLA